MFKLFRLELARLVRDKLNWTLLVILILIALINGLAVTSIDIEWMEIEYQQMLLKSSIASSFQLSSTPYIMIGLAIAVFIAKDIGQGTIRNKLIAGFSKREIYVTTLSVAAIFTLATMVIYHGVILGFSAAFGITVYVDTSVAHDLDNFLIYCAIGYLLIMVATSMVVFIGLMVKNMAGAIILTILLLTFILVLALILENVLEFTLIYQRYDLYTQAQEAEDARRRLHEILDYFYIFQALKYSTSMFNPTDINNFFSTEGGIYLYKVIGTNAALLALINVGGAYLFGRTDLK